MEPALLVNSKNMCAGCGTRHACASLLGKLLSTDLEASEQRGLEVVGVGLHRVHDFHGVLPPRDGQGHLRPRRHNEEVG